MLTIMQASSPDDFASAVYDVALYGEHKLLLVMAVKRLRGLVWAVCWRSQI